MDFTIKSWGHVGVSLAKGIYDYVFEKNRVALEKKKKRQEKPSNKAKYQ